MRVDLGKDQWAEILDVEDVPRRTKLHVQRWALDEMHKGDKHPGVIDMTMRDMLMAQITTSWSFGNPPGNNPDRIGDLPSGAYDKLLEATEAHYNDLDFLRRSTSGNSSDSRTLSEDKSPPDTSPQTDTSER